MYFYSLKKIPLKDLEVDFGNKIDPSSSIIDLSLYLSVAIVIWRSPADNQEQITARGSPYKLAYEHDAGGAPPYPCQPPQPHLSSKNSLNDIIPWKTFIIYSVFCPLRNNVLIQLPISIR